MSSSPRLVVVFLAIVVLVSPQLPHAAEPLPRVASPEEVGLSSERLDRLARVTQGHVDTGLLPGAVILIARHGKIGYFKTFGYRDRVARSAMPADAIFRLASLTKPIVSVAAMMLHEEGRFQIYDPVSQYLPEFAKPTVGVDRVSAIREMTIQDLLRHTSGLTDGGGTTPIDQLYRDTDVRNRDQTNADLVTRLAKLPLLHHPGTRWHYGLSTDVLGRLVEVVSGKTLGTFLAERIFRPLGMEDSGFWLPAAKVSRAAQPWQRPGGGPMTLRSDVAVAPRLEGGGGGLVSSATDYLRFAQMLLNGGDFNGSRLLGRKTVEFMTADHLGAIPGQQEGMGWGLGFQVRRDAGIAGLPGSVGEYGWAGNTGTIFWVDPKEQLIAIYMVQVSAEDRVYLRNQFRSLVSQAVIGRP